jgi:hypothetical protein
VNIFSEFVNEKPEEEVKKEKHDNEYQIRFLLYRHFKKKSRFVHPIEHNGRKSGIKEIVVWDVDGTNHERSVIG